MGYKPGIMNIQKYDGEAEGYKAEGGARLAILSVDMTISPKNSDNGRTMAAQLNAGRDT